MQCYRYMPVVHHFLYAVYDLAMAFRQAAIARASLMHLVASEPTVMPLTPSARHPQGVSVVS